MQLLFDVPEGLLSFVQFNDKKEFFSEMIRVTRNSRLGYIYDFEANE